MISDKYVLKWMEYIRNNPEEAKRFTECFWPSQFDSKQWLLSKIQDMQITNVVIFGGWYGILAQLISDKFPGIKIITVDLDPHCENVFKQISCGDNITSITSCASKYQYSSKPGLVINTSCEHMTQDIYSKWWDNIPNGTTYIIQGNDYFDCEEHIRCSESLEHFLNQNYSDDPDYSGILPCNNFKRYMAIGTKND